MAKAWYPELIALQARIKTQSIKVIVGGRYSQDGDHFDPQLSDFYLFFLSAVCFIPMRLPCIKVAAHSVVLQRMSKETQRRYQPRLNILACFALLHAIRSGKTPKQSSLGLR